MVNPIQFPSVGPTGTSGVPTPPVSQPGEVKGRDFKSVLLDSLDEVNRLQTEADKGVQQLMTGETDNVAEVLTAVNKAGVAFDLLMEVRNKLLDAYQEIRQMRV